MKVAAGMGTDARLFASYRAGVRQGRGGKHRKNGRLPVSASQVIKRNSFDRLSPR